MQLNKDKYLMNIKKTFHKHDTSKVLHNIDRIQREVIERKQEWATKKAHWPELVYKAD